MPSGRRFPPKRRSGVDAILRRIDPILTHQFEEGAAVFLRGLGGVGDVARVEGEHLFDISALEVLHHARFGDAQGLDTAGGGTRFIQVNVFRPERPPLCAKRAKRARLGILLKPLGRRENI